VKHEVSLTICLKHPHAGWTPTKKDGEYACTGCIAEYLHQVVASMTKDEATDFFRLLVAVTEPNNS